MGIIVRDVRAWLGPGHWAMLTPEQVLDLAGRMRALAAEMMDPLICRTPGYGAPGHAHCAACCYNLGYVVTCDEEQAMADAAIALERAADYLAPRPVRL